MTLKEKVDEVLQSAVIEESGKSKYCEYKNHDGSRHCKITTQNSCKNCRFFSPNMKKRNEIVATRIVELEAEIGELKEQIKAKKQFADSQTVTIKSLNDENAALRDHGCPDRGRCGPNDEHFDGIEIFRPQKSKKKRTKVLV